MRRLVAIAVLTTACDSGEQTGVRMDLTHLWEGAQVEFTLAELRVTGAGMAPIVLALEPTDMSFELEVPSGSARSFAIEGYDAGDPERFTMFWGFARADLSPGATVEITVPITEAGRLPGTVELSDGAPVPERIELSFDYSINPITRLPGPFVVEARAGAFSVPLPHGEYEVAVGPVAVDGTRYEPRASVSGFVDHHGVNSPLVIVLDPVCEVGGDVECCSDNDCITAGESCNLATNQCEPAQALVEVVGPDGAPHTTPQLTVFVHDSAGTYVSETTTTAAGNVSVDVAPGDMISVLYLFVEAYDYYTVLTAAGVEPGDTIKFQLPGYTVPTPEGTLNVSAATIPPAPAGTSMQTFTVGDAFGYFQAGGAAPYSYSMSSQNVGVDGNVDLLAWASSSVGEILGFSTHLNLPRAGAAITLGNWTTTTAAMNVQFLNVPGKGFTDLYPIRDGREYNLGQFLDTFSGGTYVLPSGFFDYVDVVVAPESFGSSFQKTVRRFVGDTWPATLAVDFNSDFLPPIQESPPPSVDRTDPARPSAVWSTTATSADFDLLNLQINLGDMGGLVWVLFAPSTVASPAPMPDLSNAPTQYQPVSYVGSPSRIAVELYNFDALDFRQILNNVGHAPPHHEHLPPTTMVIRASSNGVVGFGS